MGARILILFLVCLAALAVALTGGDAVKPTVTVHTLNNKQVEVPKANVDQVTQSPDPHTGLGTENGATPQVLLQDDKAASPLAPRINGPVPLAAPHQNGCLTRSIPTNYSHRVGVRPSLVVLHFTVSPNVGGWNDVNSIVAFFSRAATQASSNYVIDNEGHCVLMVPESEKAWAQAGFNSATACSIEVINTGSEATYIGGDGGPGQAKLAQVVRDCEGRWHIPNRRGATSGCAATRSGVVDHQTLGSCGGGHFDIGKFRAVDIDKTIRNAGQGAVKPVSAHAKAQCAELLALRKAKKFGKRSHALRTSLNKHGYSCSFAHGATRR